jgi:hypothetical protein
MPSRCSNHLKTSWWERGDPLFWGTLTDGHVLSLMSVYGEGRTCFTRPICMHACRAGKEAAQPFLKRQVKPMKRLLAAAVNSLTYVALCTSILALGLVAGFLLASPLSSQASAD